MERILIFQFQARFSPSNNRKNALIGMVPEIILTDINAVFGVLRALWSARKNVRTTLIKNQGYFTCRVVLARYHSLQPVKDEV